MANYHVTKRVGQTDWTVKREGAQRTSDSAPTQKDAERIAKQFAANTGGGEVRIHRPNGTIRDSDTVAPGNDPNPPRDKRH